MKKKFTLLLIVSMMLSITTKLNAQSDTIRSFIISEVMNTNRAQYVELTNRGSAALNISQFEFGSYLTWTYPKQQTSIMLPDTVLQPGATFLIADVYDWTAYATLTLGITGIEWEMQWTDVAEKADLRVYGGENEIPPYRDSVSVYSQLLQNAQYGAYYLEQHVGEDSVMVDAARLELVDGKLTPGHLLENQSVAGVSGAYYTHVLVRKASVTQGNPNWDDSRGTNMENSEWLPIPRLSAAFNKTQRYFTTIKHDGDASLNEASLSSEVVDIDWGNKKMTVPWGIYRDSIMDNFNLEGGLAWQLHFSPDLADSTHNIVRTGDTLTMYAAGNDLEQIDFLLQQGTAAADNNLVFPKNQKVYNEVTEEYIWITPYSVTQNDAVIDSVLDLGYATRVDTLFKYLEKAPNASWEIVWVDDIERVDLKRGDMLKVTAEDASTKEYFLALDSVPEASDNALLSAITWPDAPDYVQQNPQWNHDTIPKFDPQNYSYELRVPYATTNIPALQFIPADLNAKVSVDRATNINGTVDMRTTTITVTAEDDSTVTNYKVLFIKEKPVSRIQLLKTDPIITQIADEQQSRLAYLELSNPSDEAIDLSNYMIAMGVAGESPADIIQSFLNPGNFNDRYSKYIPGYVFQAKEQWESTPGIIEKDLNVDPIVEPGGTFVMGKHQEVSWFNAFPTKYYDVYFKMESWSDDTDAEYTITYGSWNHFLQLHTSNKTLVLFKITNDSIRNGTKPIGDPEDFVVVDVFGDYTEAKWSSDGQPLDKGQNDWKRKPEYWQGATLPGVQGSWGATEEESEWIHSSAQWFKAEGIGNEAAHRMTYAGLGAHTFDPITDHMSTVTSLRYKVGDGYQSPQSIVGVVTGTTVSDFMDLLYKANENQVLELMGKESGDAIANGDTLKVTSSNGVNITKYVISVGALSDDALLTSTEYTIGTSDDTGTISDIPIGTTIREVLENVTKPQTAILNVIDENDNLVPMKMLNYDTIHVETKATENVFFEVIAEDGQMVITYQLQLGVADDEAYAFSDIYEVDQSLNLVSNVPQGVNVETFLTHLKPNSGASIKLVDKIGFERTIGEVSFDDEVIVTSADGSIQKIYYLSFLEEKEGTDAYVVSNVLDIDQTLGEICCIDPGTTVEDFMALITPAPNATVKMLDTDGNPVESGTIGEGYTLHVTSGDETKQVDYTISITVGIDIISSQDNMEISVYPNPASDHVNIKGVQSGSRVVIRNTLGIIVKTVESKQIQNGTLSVSELPSGIYFITVRAEDYRSNTVRLYKH